MNLQKECKCRQNISGLNTESQKVSIFTEAKNTLSVKKEENVENVAIYNPINKGIS